MIAAKIQLNNESEKGILLQKNLACTKVYRRVKDPLQDRPPSKNIPLFIKIRSRKLQKLYNLITSEGGNYPTDSDWGLLSTGCTC